MMAFNLSHAIDILERTPVVLHDMLHGLSDEWIQSREGESSWSPYDIVGHLIHGEKTDWLPRMEIILSKPGEGAFEPFDRFAQFAESEGKTMAMLLEEFRLLRMDNVNKLRHKNISDKDLMLEGIHPAFGKVTLSQLLSTWVVHDLNHIAQICRVMSKQYLLEVGPWQAYLGILKT